MTDDLEERAKRAAGRRAVDAHVRGGTCIGLGTGSTAYYAVERAGELVRAGTPLRAVATSVATERLCERWNVPLVRFGDEPIDVAIDGADEVDPQWTLVKGAGGAMFREKAVALAARAFVCIVTERKVVAALGTAPLPVEVVPYSATWLAERIVALGAVVETRAAGNEPYRTDNGNLVLDCRFGTIADAAALDATLRALHGVVCTGIFAGLTHALVVAKLDGTIDEPARPQ
jgi:ribose 5-phosphate isomerase A